MDRVRVIRRHFHEESVAGAEPGRLDHLIRQRQLALAAKPRFSRDRSLHVGQYDSGYDTYVHASYHRSHVVPRGNRYGRRARDLRDPAAESATELVGVVFAQDVIGQGGTGSRSGAPPFSRTTCCPSAGVAS